MKMVGALLVGAALWLPLCAVGSAHADAAQASYVNQLVVHGISGTSDQLLNKGYCNVPRTGRQSSAFVG
jgi:hypothetical protein